MREPKVLLFYFFTPLRDPEALVQWQRVLCESLGLRGRIILSPHGINGTVGGGLRECKRYIKAMKQYAPFRQIDFKWSEGTGHDFPRLSVKARPELVAFGVPDEVIVTERGVLNGGIHLTPNEVDELVASRGDDVVFFDGRNAFEAAVGRFRNAVIPNIKTTHDFIEELESGKFDSLKSRPVITYCTGGIRCEVLSVLMKNRGFSEVYQIDGGVVRYGEAKRDRGLWEGALYVFDERQTMTFSDDAVTLGACETCHAPTSSYVNCNNLACRALILQCETCHATWTEDRCDDTHRNRR